MLCYRERLPAFVHDTTLRKLGTANATAPRCIDPTSASRERESDGSPLPLADAWHATVEIGRVEQPIVRDDRPRNPISRRPRSSCARMRKKASRQRGAGG